jgi:hypothetical protein
MNKPKLIAVLAVIAILGVALPASSLAAGTFPTGRYRGTTSQHTAVTFVLRHATGCSAKTENVLSYCLGTTKQAFITLKCPDGTTTNSYLDPQGPLNASGVLSGTTHGTSETTDRLYLKVTHGGNLSGYVELRGAESISGTGPVCSSGKVRFTAKHV